MAWPVLTVAELASSCTGFIGRNRFLAPAMLAAFLSGTLADRYWLTDNQRTNPPPIAEDSANAEDNHHQISYLCPMHHEVISDKPGFCPICGMALVPMTQGLEGGGKPVVQIAPEVVNNLGVRIEPVIRKTITRRIEAPGFVQQIETTGRVRVQAPFDARIAKLYVKPEQWLEAGDALLTFESPLLTDAEQTHIALLTAEAIPPDEASRPAAAPTPEQPATPLDVSRRRLADFGLSVEDIRRLERDRNPSGQLQLFAPNAGSVSDMRIAEQDWVKTGTSLFEISGLARATVLANAFQRDAAWIQNGKQVEIRLPHVSNRIWPGIVNQGAVSLDPSSQNIGIRLSFTAPANLLKSAMYVVARIHGERHENVLGIPSAALIRTETEDRVVLALGEGRFKPTPVQVGMETDGEAEIIAGLREGDRVVTSSQFLLDSESNLRADLQRMSGSSK